MSTAIDIAFLLVYVLGAFAYGSALTLSVRQAAPVWAPHHTHGGSSTGRIDPAGVVLFAWSALWFVVLTLDQFIDMATGPSRRGWLDLLQLALVFGFPPLIMHTTQREAHVSEWPEPSRSWARRALAAGYVLAVAAAVAGLGVAVQLWQVPNADIGVGLAIAGLFTMSGVFSSVVLHRNPRGKRTPEGDKLRKVLNGLFVILALMNFVPVLSSSSAFSFGTLGKLMSVTPLLFLSATTYYENRFEFYDLLVKRGAMLLATLLALSAYYVVVLPLLDVLPHDSTRPWLFALAAVPLMMAAPRLSRRLSQQLDRAWFGRHYTPVSAVTTVLSSLQTATDEASLLALSEASLKEVLGVTVRLSTLDDPPVDVRTAFKIDGSAADPSLWVIVPVVHGERVLLSEDLTLLRSLGTVITYLVENIRLQQRRQEQDLLAQELRLQSSQSELKALRAQINPHFLFNALNTVASLIHSDPARADRAVEQLSEVFRHTLRRSDSEWAPLDQELTFAAAYLDVEEARFGARLRYTIEADAAARRAHVPAMLVHTLVENAVKHGIAQVRGHGTLDVVATAAGARLTIDICDNGPGLEQTPERAAFARRAGEQFGLRSVRDRLRGHFGEAATFTLMRDPLRNLTIARIDMPLVGADHHAVAAAEATA
ncbi:MAG: histidine kinase [Acidobacteria bacterium]|nr:histidine kinase [Acidobacteriota bacterium]